MTWFARSPKFRSESNRIGGLKVFCCTGKGEDSSTLELDDDNDDDDYDDVGSRTTAARRGGDGSGKRARLGLLDGPGRVSPAFVVRAVDDYCCDEEGSPPLPPLRSCPGCRALTRTATTTTWPRSASDIDVVEMVAGQETYGYAAAAAIGEVAATGGKGTARSNGHERRRGRNRIRRRRQRRKPPKRYPRVVDCILERNGDLGPPCTDLPST